MGLLTTEDIKCCITTTVLCFGTFALIFPQGIVEALSDVKEFFILLVVEA